MYNIDTYFYFSPCFKQCGWLTRMNSQNARLLFLPFSSPPPPPSLHYLFLIPLSPPSSATFSSLYAFAFSSSATVCMMRRRHLASGSLYARLTPNHRTLQLSTYPIRSILNW